jgi:nuclear cap-binding protein subunit 2
MAQSAVGLYLKFESGLIEGVSSYLVTRKQFRTPEQWRLQVAQLAKSTTIYIGNLSFYTSEDQIHAHFSTAGLIKRVIMGINKNTKQACGFAFVEYFDHQSAFNAKQALHKTKLGGRLLKVDIDEGFDIGRLYGRGDDGQQIRDSRRTDFDSDRGGYSERMKRLDQQYQLGDGVGDGGSGSGSDGVVGLGGNVANIGNIGERNVVVEQTIEGGMMMHQQQQQQQE